MARARADQELADWVREIATHAWELGAIAVLTEDECALLARWWRYAYPRPTPLWAAEKLVEFRKRDKTE